MTLNLQDLVLDAAEAVAPDTDEEVFAPNPGHP